MTDRNDLKFGPKTCFNFDCKLIFSVLYFIALIG